MKTAYANYRQGAVEYDTSKHSFSLIYGGKGIFIKNARVTKVIWAGREIGLDAFELVEFRTEDVDDGRRLLITYGGGSELLNGVRLDFLVGESSFSLSTYSIHAQTIVHDSNFIIQGDIDWGMDQENSTFAVRLSRVGSDLRMASGPASSTVDNALFDRLTDSVLVFSGAKNLHLFYDWDKKGFCFSFESGENWHDYRQTITIHENYYSRKFGIPYRPINKTNTFPRPPVGWMTWYSVKFDASESTVLENTRWLSSNLKDFGANCIWVDWEWYHSNFLGCEIEGVDTFHPNVQKYPRGLNHVSEEIKKHGLIPALWIGATNDPNKNRMLLEHPDWILANQKEWCGQWWVDLSHPDVIAQYIPAIFRKIMDWGYKAIKWDCIPTTLTVLDQHHESFHVREKSSTEAFRDAVEAARKVIGKETYLLLCAGINSRTLTFAMDLFDGARIGGDVFAWEEFVRESVAHLPRYLCFHNVLLYIDLDNVVLRKEFNDNEQAISRASFVSLSGAPFTIGDNLPELDEARVEILKRSIPVLDSHPMDLRPITIDTSVVLLNLSIARRFENWNVVDIFNTRASQTSITIDLGGDLHLETAEDARYLVYDFWGKKLIGTFHSFIDVTLPPYGSKILSFRRLLNRPQLVSTSRHISQGGYDLIEVQWDEEKCCLSGLSKIVKNDTYRITLHVPTGYVLTRVTSDCPAVSGTAENASVWIDIQSTETRNIRWSVQFEKAA